MRGRRNIQERTGNYENKFATGPVGSLLNYVAAPKAVEEALVGLRSMPSLDLPNHASKGFSANRSWIVDPSNSVCAQLNKSRPPERTKYKTPYGVYGQFTGTTSEYQDHFFYGPEHRKMQRTVTKTGEYTHIFDNTRLHDFDVEALKQKRLLSPLCKSSALYDAVAVHRKAPMRPSATVVAPVEPVVEPPPTDVPDNSPPVIHQRQHHLSQRLKKTIKETYQKQVSAPNGVTNQGKPYVVGVKAAKKIQIPTVAEITAMQDHLNKLHEEIEIVQLEEQVQKLLD